MTHFARILWLDLEMSGLDSGSDLILEVAAIATDWDFKELGTYEGIVKNEADALQERLRANGAFWDRHQQARDGLLRQNAEGRVLQEPPFRAGEACAAGRQLRSYRPAVRDEELAAAGCAPALPDVRRDCVESGV
jgi:hypothetical protein